MRVTLAKQSASPGPTKAVVIIEEALEEALPDVDVDAKEFDAVVFGGSGVAGAYVVEELAKIAESENIKWAVAGRNEEKLRRVLEDASVYSGMSKEDLSKVAVIVADVTDPESLESLCRRTKVVLNCVGPYALYGEPVVAAAIKEKASHLDVSGEPLFLESMVLKYHRKAQEAGVYVVGSCGLDSIPCDLGIAHLRNNFGGELNSVETYTSGESKEDKLKQINFGTWQSAIHGVHAFKEVERVREEINKEIFTKPLPAREFPMKPRGPIFRNPEVRGWCLPFPGCDMSTATRTQLSNYNHHDQPPVQIQCYANGMTIFQVLLHILMAAVFGFLAFFEAGRRLLEAHPELFSMGVFTRRRPTRKEVAGDSYLVAIHGEGWAEKAHAGKKPDKKAKVLVKGPDPGYVNTSICMVQSAISVLKEADKMPKNGGVLSPGFAFINTTLVERLAKHGVEFTYSE